MSGYRGYAAGPLSAEPSDRDIQGSCAFAFGRLPADPCGQQTRAPGARELGPPGQTVDPTALDLECGAIGGVRCMTLELPSGSENLDQRPWTPVPDAVRGIDEVVPRTGEPRRSPRTVRSRIGRSVRYRERQFRANLTDFQLRARARQTFRRSVSGTASRYQYRTVAPTQTRTVTWTAM